MNVLIPLLFAFSVVQSVVSQHPFSLVNFKHLEHLSEEIVFAGEQVSIVHVYANYPDYHWVTAAESGPEGIACVDDVARAAVLYLRHYELMSNHYSLAKAQLLLKFILKMQAEDGEFYNFVHEDHSINKEGKTSYKSFGWWAARGVWAMAIGYRVLKDVDPPFANRLKVGVENTFPYVDSLLLNYGKTKTVSQYRVPQWLLYASAADATSELLLGLIEYYSATNSDRVGRYIRKFGEGFVVMQDGDIATFPYGLHRSWETIWHAWGNGQTQTLATAGKILPDTSMIRSAEREAQGFFSRLLIEGFMKELDVANPEKKREFEQIAYGIRPMAVGLLRLYDATRNETYLKMAGLAASWLFGNNAVGQPMYDAATGRCYDGILDSIRINKNSGAESTIEALMTLVELERYPAAMEYLDFRKVYRDSTSRYLYTVFRNGKGRESTLALDMIKSDFRIFEGKESKNFQSKANEQ